MILFVHSPTEIIGSLHSTKMTGLGAFCGAVVIDNNGGATGQLDNLLAMCLHGATS
jgi:hypothetical protein